MHEDEPVTSCRQFPDGVEVTTDRGRYLAKVLIGADGANSLVAQQLFPGRRSRLMATLESEIPIGPAPHYPGTGRALIDIGATPAGYAWIFPKQERLSIGVGDLRGGLASPKKFSISSCEARKDWLHGRYHGRSAIHFRSSANTT